MSRLSIKAAEQAFARLGVVVIAASKPEGDKKTKTAFIVQGNTILAVTAPAVCKTPVNIGQVRSAVGAYNSRSPGN